MDLKKYLSEKQLLIESVLEKSISKDNIPLKLFDSMKYSLMAGGKRLRPVLSVAGAEAVSGEIDDALHFGIALEMIHTFSLIHDDLPAMDDDDLRRGKPTNHKIFGEATAILSGDGLLAEAFYYFLSNVDNKKNIQALKLLSYATGARGMTGGQQIDMDSEGKNVDLEELEKLHKMKTGALIKAAVVGGAMLAGADDKQLKDIGDYGEYLGLAFQIADDILDIEGDESLIGKPVGSDVQNFKSTYPALLGLGGAKELALDTSKKAIQSIHDFSESAWPLRDLANYVITREK